MERLYNGAESPNRCVYCYKYAVIIETDDFSSGGLRQSSNIRPNRLFTADKQIILYKAGQLKLEKINEVITRIVDILQQ